VRWAIVQLVLSEFTGTGGSSILCDVNKFNGSSYPMSPMAGTGDLSSPNEQWAKNWGG
jgi:hypothetical protein